MDNTNDALYDFEWTVAPGYEWQDWLDRYELEPYLLFKALGLKHRVVEVPVTIEYPKTDGIAYTKMRAITDWWKIFRPVLFLALRLKNVAWTVILLTEVEPWPKI